MDESNDIRIRYADKYMRNIHNSRIKLSVTDSHAGHVYHLFPVLVDDQKEFQEYMLENGIKTQIHYPIPPFMAERYEGTPAGRGEEGKVLFPNAYYIATHEVSLPIYSGMKEEDVDEVIRVANGYLYSFVMGFTYLG